MAKDNIKLSMVVAGCLMVIGTSLVAGGLAHHFTTKDNSSDNSSIVDSITSELPGDENSSEIEVSIPEDDPDVSIPEEPGTSEDSGTPEPIHIFDCEMTEEKWTDEVKANKYVARSTNGNCTIDLYATRDEYGLYFFVNYKTNTHDLENAVNWWEGVNFEMTFTGENGKFKNQKEIILESENQFQFWASAWSNLETKTNFTAGEWKKGEDEFNGMITFHHYSFELFLSYSQLIDGDTTATIDSLIGLGFGSNPGGNYWACDSGYSNDNLSECYQITTSGIIAPGA